MEVQLVRLAYKRLKNNQGNYVANFVFKYSDHGTGRIEAAEDMSLPAAAIASGLWTVQTGLSFMLISRDPTVSPGGYYYTALPVINPNLTAVYQTTSSTTRIECPFALVACSTPYNLECKKNKSGLELTFGLRTLDEALTPNHVIRRGETLCYVHFPVVFDLLDQISCYEYS